MNIFKNRQTGLWNRLVFIVFGILILAGIVTYSLVFLVLSADLFHYLEFNFTFSFVLAVLLSVIIGTIITSQIGKQILSPMMKLNSALREVANGNFLTTLNTDTSIKEINEIFLNFNQMVSELKGIEMMRNDFVTNISHEFKTPLSAIEGYTTLLQDEEIEDDERKQYIQVILESSRQLSSLSTDILKLSKLDNQDKVTDKNDYRLDEQIRQVLLTFEEIWSKKELNLSLDLPKVYIYQNEILLRQVWSNLISNAIKFTPQNGRIQITLNELDKQIIVSIKDNGIGMNSDIKKHIFDKFYQGDRSRAMEGNGLGLSLVKRIIQLSDGEIYVNSEAGKGSEFKVIFSK
ncbi:Alkaline phosphatase synthesis sensor protein PhoR [compost metagenome]